MSYKDSRHPSRPPSVLMNGSIKTPSPEEPVRPHLRSLRRSLPIDQLLQVDPLALRLCEERGTRLRTKVPDDDTTDKNKIYGIRH